MREEHNCSTEILRIPREVYYRCIWLVRDSDRLERIAGSQDLARPGETAALPEGQPGILSEDTIRRAEDELDAINAALDRIPDVYRMGIILNITEKKPFSDLAHPNTWKKWKQIFIYELARELHLL